VKTITASNAPYGDRGPSQRCTARVKAKIPEENPEGWHICQLKQGHPGPHQCVHGEFPEGVRYYEPGPDGGKLIAMH
jgi:hypothetical protein